MFRVGGLGFGVQDSYRFPTQTWALRLAVVLEFHHLQ